MAAILFYVRKNELNYLDFYFALWIVLYAFCLHSHCPFGGEKKKKLPSVPDVAKQFSTSLLWTSQVTQQAVKDPPAMQETTCNAGDAGSVPGSGRSPGGGNGNLLRILAWKIP